MALLSWGGHPRIPDFAIAFYGCNCCRHLLHGLSHKAPFDIDPGDEVSLPVLHSMGGRRLRVIVYCHPLFQ